MFENTWPIDRIVEHKPRVTVPSHRPAHEASYLLNGNPIRVVRDCLSRAWWECPRCGRRCRHIYLDGFACRVCLKLDYSVRHIARWTPHLYRIKRWRRQLARYGVDPRPFTAIGRIPGSRDRIHGIIRMIRAAEAALLGDVHDFTEDQMRRDERAAQRRRRRA